MKIIATKPSTSTKVANKTSSTTTSPTINYSPTMDYTSAIAKILDSGNYSTNAKTTVQNYQDARLAKIQDPKFSQYAGSGFDAFTDKVNAYLGLGGNESAYSPTTDPYVDQYMQLLQQQRAQEEAALRARIEAGVQQNNAYIPQVNQAYADQQKQNYISREMAKSSLPENMAALGLSGGASESALLGVNTNYENLRGQADTEKNRALEQIRQNEANIRSSGDASLAGLAGNYLQQQMQVMQQAQARADEQARWQAEYGLKQSAHNAELEQQTWANALNREQLDYTKSQDTAISPYIAWQMYNNGVRTPQVLSVLGISGSSAAAPASVNATASKSASAAASPGAASPAYTEQQIMNEIMGNRTQSGAITAAQKMIARGASESTVRKVLQQMGFNL